MKTVCMVLFLVLCIIIQACCDSSVGGSHSFGGHRHKSSGPAGRKAPTRCDGCKKWKTGMNNLRKEIKEIQDKISFCVPATPSAVNITAISNSSVAVSVDLPAGKYDGVEVELCTAIGQPPVSSGSLLVPELLLTADGTETFTIPSLSPPLSPGESYSVKVKARSGCILSDVGVASAIATVPPATPSAVNITAISNSSVTVSVDLPAGKYDGVEVELCEATGPPPVSTGSSPVAEFTLTADGTETFTIYYALSTPLTPGESYTVKLKTRSGSVFSDTSVVSDPTIIIPPATPSAVNITAISNSSVAVSVDLPAGKYDGVEVELCEATGPPPVSSGSSPVAEFTLTADGTETFTIYYALSTPLTPGESYTVKLKTRSGSVFSDTSVVSDPTIIIPPATPSAVNITAISNSSVAVSVDLPAGKYDGVEVELCEATGPPPVSSGSSPVAEFTLTADGTATFTVDALSTPLTPGESYTVKLKTRSGSVFSDTSVVSDPSIIIPLATPSAVSITSISTSRVKVCVDLPAGKYDGVDVELCVRDTGPPAVSFGSLSVDEFTLTSVEKKTFPVSSLAPPLTPGENYTVKVKSRIGAVFSDLSVASDPATALEVAEGTASLTIVFDTTGTMTPEFRQLTASTPLIVAATEGRLENPLHNYVLVPFNDPAVGPVTMTTDPDEYQLQLQALIVGSGGDCPELAIEGVMKALEVSLPKSFIYVITDASAKDFELKEEVFSLVQEKQSRVVFFLTGPVCSLARSAAGFKVYDQIASISSGQVFLMRQSEVAEVLNLVGMVTQFDTVNLLAIDRDGANSVLYTLPVDSLLQEFTVFVSGNEPNIALVDPNGTLLMVDVDYTELLRLKSVLVVNVKDPIPGLWSLEVGSTSLHTIRVTGISSLDFAIKFAQLGTTPFDDADFRPVKGVPNHVFIKSTFPDPAETFTTLELVNLKGEQLTQSAITQDPDDLALFTVPSFEQPDEFFYLKVGGTDELGNTLNRLSPTAIIPEEAA